MHCRWPSNWRGGSSARPARLPGNSSRTCFPWRASPRLRWRAPVISMASLTARRRCLPDCARRYTGGAEPSSFAGRAHQHQSQQGCAHRPPAQRHPGRYFCSPAARRRPTRRCAELHRQHRGAGSRRGGRPDSSGRLRSGRRSSSCWWTSRQEGSGLTTTAGTSMRGFRSGTAHRKRRRRNESRFVWIRCMPSRLEAMRLRRSPTWFRPRCSAGIWRPCCGWGLNMIFFPGKARSSTSSFGIWPSSS